MTRRKACIAAAIGLALAGCGLPPIVNGARFLVLVDSGVDVAQLDFVDQRTCLAAQRSATGTTARCQWTTLWSTLLVRADVDLPDRTRIEGHFLSVDRCERTDLLSRIGAAVVRPCLPPTPAPKPSR